ncbi:MAG: AbrB/MazE/SpoVT family DNA-binding domain-containing protein [Calditrichaeota bacterium]|nr:AbrB/MazE/SpoVT family DNA-binding domain-containing protein [Calditrichota bacterium]
MTKVQVQSAGSALQITLPEELVKSLGVRAGDNLFISIIGDGEAGAWVSSFDPKSLKVLKATDKVMAEYDHTLRELAK